MAEEETTVAGQEESAVSDADLDAAAAAVSEESQSEEETPAEETPAITLESLAEEVKKIGDLAETYKGLNGRMRNIHGMLNQLARQPAAKEPEVEQVSYLDDPDAWLESKLNARDKQKEADKKTYESDFLTKVAELGADEPDEEDRKGIEEELFANFNKRFSNNGAADAATNYAKATRAYLRKQTAKPIETTKGEKPPGRGITTQSSDTKAAKPIKLDEHAQAYVNYTGMKDEDVQKTLSSEAPIMSPSVTVVGGK